MKNVLGIRFWHCPFSKIKNFVFVSLSIIVIVFEILSIVIYYFGSLSLLFCHLLIIHRVTGFSVVFSKVSFESIQNQNQADLTSYRNWNENKIRIGITNRT